MESSKTSLASRTHFEVLGLEGQVLENWPVLGSRTALFFESLKFCGALEKFFGKRFFVEIAGKIFVKTSFFFGEHLRLCPWSLASSIPVLGLESACPRKGCPWPWIFFVSLALASNLVSSTLPLVITINDNEQMVSFDVVSIFTKIPVELAVEIAKSRVEALNNLKEIITSW